VAEAGILGSYGWGLTASVGVAGHCRATRRGASGPRSVRRRDTRRLPPGRSARPLRPPGGSAGGVRVTDGEPPRPGVRIRQPDAVHRVHRQLRPPDSVAPTVEPRGIPRAGADGVPARALDGQPEPVLPGFDRDSGSVPGPADVSQPRGTAVGDRGRLLGTPDGDSRVRTRRVRPVYRRVFHRRLRRRERPAFFSS